MDFHTKQFHRRNITFLSFPIIVVMIFASSAIAFLLLTSCRFQDTDLSSSFGKPTTTESFSSLQKDFESFCLAVFWEELTQGSTLDLHYTLIHPESYGIDSSEPTLGRYGLVDLVHNKEDLKELRAQLLTFDPTALTVRQQITYDALLETLETELLAEGMELYEQPLAPTIGIQAQLPMLLAEYAFHSLDDAEDYLCLLEQLDLYYKSILDFEYQKADAGLGPSDAAIDRIVASCEGYLQSSNFLSETFASRLKLLTASAPLSDATIQQLLLRHETAVREHFLPAYELLVNGMRELKGRGIHDSGLAGCQNGTRYYEYLVKSGSGTSYAVPELKTALSKRMLLELKELNALYTEYPDLDDRLSSARFSLSDPHAILKDLQENMKSQFPDLGACAYEIRYVPEGLEPFLSPAFYLTTPLDNTDQNVIYINPSYSDPADNLYTTLAHEGFPGHLYQTVYSRKTLKEAPLLSILSCSGANEGWATYVEYYANLFDNGLPDGVGRYYAALRSYSLCVHGLLDIGIHYEGWDREQAGQFVSSCFQIDDETMEELWQTILDNPTNYLDYCGGFVELMEMREEAEQVLGDGFSALEFHKFLLDLGPVPFSVIRKYFHTWLYF